jgi:type VI secretion system secreted protein VgrG
MYPWAGPNFGIIHVPRVGTEVLVDFINGDPDRPVVIGQMYNAANMPPWQLPPAHNPNLAGFRSQEIRGSRANAMVLDDTKDRIGAQLNSDEGDSGLRVGWITRLFGHLGRKEARGRGFELTTQLWGVMRGMRGLLITTETNGGPVKEMGETVARLETAQQLQDNMAAQARGHHAQNAGTDQDEIAQALKAQNDAIQGGIKTNENPFPEFTEPHLTLSSPAGIESTTAASTHIASSQHTALTTGLNLSIAAGKSLVASVRERISFFAETLGISLIAAAGKIRADAKSSSMELLAQTMIQILCRQGPIHVETPDEIVFNANGTELKLNGSGAFIRTPGVCEVHSTTLDKHGPESVPLNIPAEPHSQQFTFIDPETGNPLGGVKYQIIKESGEVIEGTTGEDGKTSQTTNSTAEKLAVRRIS